ncbi:hypothetical protein THIAE_09615 [Thiomicrospira aerophila AL3]|uniref:TniQ domain-containing protein n=1 Tax=Thiomicrospira aerophila AL3 TaxID=717772 RepID=W0DZH3_9GAMM|nr:TniQ family protein [Thiomicrospira aerophila]AHF02389.1 hypothetical protein THIAE_09615 [Thiomicrospira aerophila AL3]
MNSHRLWPILIPIEDDELLSSWLIRNALANGSDPMTWTWYFWGKWRAWTLDFDRYCPDVMLYRIANAPFDINTLRKATLLSIAANINSAQLNPKTNWNWVIPQGSRNRDRSTGLRCCPECLNEKAYFKKSWRLAWNHSCPTHKTILLDKCPNCGLPISPHKANQDNPDICICPRCQFDLRLAHSKPANSRALNAQLLLNNAINHEGSVSFAWGTNETKELFSTVHLMLRFLHFTCTHPATLTKFRKVMCLPVMEQEFIMGVSIEQYPPDWIHTLFCALDTLLSMEIKSLIKHLAAHDVTQKMMIKNKTNLTETFAFIASKLRSSETKPTTVIRARTPIKPKSKDEVDKMWLDIQRYL